MADFDLFVIGAGSGGVRAARVSAAYGAKVAIAEEYKVGGTCVIRGCVPKKLLVYGAHFAEDLDDAAMFGWDVPQKRFDWPVLRDNVLAEVGRLEGAYTETLTNHEVDDLPRARGTDRTKLDQARERQGSDRRQDPDRHWRDARRCRRSRASSTRSAPTKCFISSSCRSASSSPAAAISPTSLPASSSNSAAM